MEQFSVDQGLPHTDVFATVQDNDGFIWIGTSSGQCRYDGVEIRTYDISNSILESSRIASLYLEDDGLLYVGTEAGGLTLYDTANDRFVKTVKVPSNCVNSVFGSDDGRIYICTNDGLSKLERDGGSYNVTSWSFGAVVLTGCSLGGNEVLVGTSKGLARFSESGGLRVVDNGIFATSHLALDDGRLLLTSYDGIFTYNPDNDGFEKIGPYESRSVCSGGSGDIYVGTMRNGVLHYSAGLEVLDTYSPSNSGFSSDVSALLYDRSSVLWIGTIGKGCFRSNAYSRAFHLYPLLSDSQQQVVTMASDSRHRLWVSYKDGTVAVLKDGALSFLNKSSLSMFASMPVSAIWEAPDGNIWLGSWDHGAGIIPVADVEAACSGGRFRLDRPYGLPERISIYRFASDRFSSVWTTTASGVFRSPIGFLQGRVNQDKWQNLRNDYRDASSLSDDFTTDIMVDEVDGKSVVWIGSRTGLNRIVCDENGRIIGLRRVRVAPDKDAVEFISFIHKDGNGSLWVSALGLGLGKLLDSKDPEAFVFRLYNKSSDPEFPDNEFESVQEDGDGNFWIGGHGLVRFNPSDGSVRCFSRGDGLQSNSFKIWDSADIGDGRLAFGGVGGFNVFDPDDINEIGGSKVPETNITGFTAGGEPVVTKDGTPVRRTKDIVLDSKRNSLVFRFATMSYSAPARNLYRYMLEGLDDRWHETTGANPSAAYPNVRPGRYSFVVYGADSNEVWASDPVRLSVRIRPPWYLSWVAIVAYALALLLAAWVIFTNYKKRSDRRHREDVEKKLRAEQQERNEEELKFHTDFLHEIKTPLTLITTPVEELLPEVNTVGHAHKYAATALMARAYLQMSGYPLQDKSAAALAADACKRVISSGRFALVKDYFSQFDGKHEHNSEYIFDVEFDNTASSSLYGGQVGTVDGLPHVDQVYWTQVRAFPEMYKKFDPEDLRRDAINNGGHVVYNKSTGKAEIVYDTDYEGNYWVYKFRHPLDRSDRGSTWANWCNNINFPIIRYADVLLMLAEAENRANGAPSAQALEYVNQVRRRGFGKDINTPDPAVDLPMSSGDAFGEVILKERSLELCFEGHRWADLVRFGKLQEAYRSVGNDPEWLLTPTYQTLKENCKEKHSIFPIPQSVIDASNGAIEQNPIWK